MGIPNNQLSIVHLPDKHAPLVAWILFASTFDGYEYCGGFESAVLLSQKIEQAYHDDPSALSRFTLSELRADLFFEHRRFMNFNRDPDKNEFQFWIDLVAEIEKKIKSHQLL